MTWSVGLVFLAGQVDASPTRGPHWADKPCGQHRGPEGSGGGGLFAGAGFTAKAPPEGGGHQGRPAAGQHGRCRLAGGRGGEGSYAVTDQPVLVTTTLS